MLHDISDNKYTKLHSPILLYNQVIQENVILDFYQNVNITCNIFDHVHMYKTLTTLANEKEQ